MKKLLYKIIGILVIVCICFAIFLGTKYYYSKQIKTVEVIKEVEKTVEKVVEKEIQISGETMRSNLANIGKLCTAEYGYTHVEQFDSSRKINDFKIPFTTSSFIYSYDGTIMAGIDFTKIQVVKNDTNKVITVTLPDVEIISSSIDQDSFQLYDETNNIFNPIHVTDVTDSLANLQKSEEEKAIAEGLLDKARANASLLVENFMHSSYDIGEYEVNVQFQ
ncbi:MAG: DUF4230 domain-containing protein [Lachnospiraceae bacterium]|nr:DUF4230 domain-containing protein [Lachnospiraceae bacterium]